jgi:Polyketide cyclase / dehydrase and lipid transport
MHGSVTVRMGAPADSVWNLLTDVTRIGEFSPETFEAEWLDAADGPQVGARFRGHVRRNGRGPVYWTTCTVVASEPGREFAFAVISAGRILNTWRYRLAPAGGGALGEARDGTGGEVRDGNHDSGQTDVTESFQLADTPLLRMYWLAAGHWRMRTNLRGMRTTLERIKAAVESV